MSDTYSPAAAVAAATLDAAHDNTETTNRRVACFIEPSSVATNALSACWSISHRGSVCREKNTQKAQGTHHQENYRNRGQPSLKVATVQSVNCS